MMDLLSDEVQRMLAAHNEPMETAIKAMFALGYHERDLRIMHHEEVNGGRRYVLMVRGVSAFEVRSSFRSERGDGDQYFLTYSIRPRILTWPPPNAPQGHAPSTDGGAQST